MNPTKKVAVRIIQRIRAGLIKRLLPDVHWAFVEFAGERQQKRSFGDMMTIAISGYDPTYRSFLVNNQGSYEELTEALYLAIHPVREVSDGQS